MYYNVWNVWILKNNDRGRKNIYEMIFYSQRSGGVIRRRRKSIYEHYPCSSWQSKLFRYPFTYSSYFLFRFTTFRLYPVES